MCEPVPGRRGVRFMDAQPINKNTFYKPNLHRGGTLCDDTSGRLISPKLKHFLNFVKSLCNFKPTILRGNII